MKPKFPSSRGGAPVGGFSPSSFRQDCKDSVTRLTLSVVSSVFSVFVFVIPPSSHRLSLDVHSRGCLYVLSFLLPGRSTVSLFGNVTGLDL